MVYKATYPYLKGFHLTLTSHLPQRNDEGQKITDLEWIGRIENKVDRGSYTREQGDLLLLGGQ